MKKILYLFLSVFVLFGSISPICLAWEGDGWDGNDEFSPIEHDEWDSARRVIKHNPVKLLDTIYYNANRTRSEEVQSTQYDFVSSTACANVPGTFAISNTLCNLKSLSGSYLQYIMYIWLTVATIMIIRNWFKLVTSQDREKQIRAFRTNLVYIVIWVILLIWFYYILDFFVSTTNLIFER